METASERLDKLWKKISSDESDARELLENLVFLEKTLETPSDGSVTGDNSDPVNAFYSWIVHRCLPSTNFAGALESAYSADSGKKRPLTKDEYTWQSICSTGISCLKLLNKVYPIQKAENFLDILVLLASFTSEADPWTTIQSREQAYRLLKSSMQSQRPSCWSVLGDLLKAKIRPIFSKTKHTAITSAGRKNFHPIPQARFDSSFLDNETKPWKFNDVYATTVLEWILSQFNSSNYAQAEEYLPLFVPPILSLIDDDSLPFKTRGCRLLSQFLLPLKEIGSDFLKRTNLSSVFEEAVIPCLLSLPTITPEEESLQMLKAAYPTLLMTLQVGYTGAADVENAQIPRTATSSRTDPQKIDRSVYIQKISAIVRANIISSFHHISSSTPAAATSSTTPSTISSFPYPRLSAYLLTDLSIYIGELGIHTSKYLQDIIPVLYITLTNPFGTAHPPLLEAAILAARSTILNAYPRIWRFRGELLSGLCTCWLHVLEEDAEGTTRPPFVHLKKQLQEVAYLLRESIDATVRSVTPQRHQTTNEGETGSGNYNLINWIGLEEEIDIRKEYEDLVQADESLKGLLMWKPNQWEVEGNKS